MNAEQYLTWERAQLDRHEFFRGGGDRVVLSSGVSLEVDAVYAGDLEADPDGAALSAARR